MNCRFGPATSLKTMKLMKEGLQAAGLKAHLMVQALGFHMPDCGKGGFVDLPEYPFGKFRCIIEVLVIACSDKMKTAMMNNYGMVYNTRLVRQKKKKFNVNPK